MMMFSSLASRVDITFPGSDNLYVATVKAFKRRVRQKSFRCSGGVNRAAQEALKILQEKK
jgi:hypothetical protein